MFICSTLLILYHIDGEVNRMVTNVCFDMDSQTMEPERGSSAQILSDTDKILTEFICDYQKMAE